MFSPVWLTRWTVCYLSHFYHVWTSLKYSPGLSHPPFKCLYLKWNPATPLRSLRHLLWNSLCISQHRALSLNVDCVSSLGGSYLSTLQWIYFYFSVRYEPWYLHGCETWYLHGVWDLSFNSRHQKHSAHFLLTSASCANNTTQCYSHTVNTLWRLILENEPFQVKWSNGVGYFDHWAGTVHNRP